MRLKMIVFGLSIKNDTQVTTESKKADVKINGVIQPPQ